MKQIYSKMNEVLDKYLKEYIYLNYGHLSIFANIEEVLMKDKVKLICQEIQIGKKYKYWIEKDGSPVTIPFNYTIK